MNDYELKEASCSRCRKTKSIENFHGVRKQGLLNTCSECRKPRPDANARARAWRAKKKAEGVKVDKRGKSRNAYMRDYQRRRKCLLLEKELEVKTPTNPCAFKLADHHLLDFFKF